jgi:hypothetical protein
MPSAEYDLEYLRAIVEGLEDYLLSKELYWSLGVAAPRGEPAFPPLTLGGLLLAQARLHARDLAPGQRDQLVLLEERVDGIRSRWRVAWGRKAAHDFRARLNLWRDFLEEYRQNTQGNVDRYAYEVGRRVMLHLLAPEAESIPPTEAELLAGLDRLLRAVFVPGDFVWEAELAGGFPLEVYWYLYGQLKT